MTTRMTAAMTATLFALCGAVSAQTTTTTDKPAQPAAATKPASSSTTQQKGKATATRDLNKEAMGGLSSSNTQMTPEQRAELKKQRDAKRADKAAKKAQASTSAPSTAQTTTK